MELSSYIFLFLNTAQNCLSFSAKENWYDTIMTRNEKQLLKYFIQLINLDTVVQEPNYLDLIFVAPSCEKPSGSN